MYVYITKSEFVLSFISSQFVILQQCTSLIFSQETNLKAVSKMNPIILKKKKKKKKKQEKKCQLKTLALLFSFF